MNAAAAESVSLEQDLAASFRLQRNPFSAAENELADRKNLPRVVDEARRAVVDGHLLTIVTGSSRSRQAAFVDRLSATFGEEIRFLALHGDKLSFSAEAPRSSAPARLHQSIDQIEFVVESAITQAARVERAGLLVDHADELNEASLLTLLDFVERSQAQQPPVQLVLVGSEGVLAALTEPACARFSQLTARHYPLERLTLEEARELVSVRLEQAGGAPDLVPDEAVDAAYELTGGFADELLRLGLWSLWFARERQIPEVTPELVYAAAETAVVPPASIPGHAGAGYERGYLEFQPGKLAAFPKPTVEAFQPPELTVPIYPRRHGGVAAVAQEPAPDSRRRRRALMAAFVAVLLVIPVSLIVWQTLRRAPDAVAPVDPPSREEAVPRVATGADEPAEPDLPAAAEPDEPSAADAPAGAEPEEPPAGDAPVAVEPDQLPTSDAPAAAESEEPAAAPAPEEDVAPESGAAETRAESPLREPIEPPAAAEREGASAAAEAEARSQSIARLLRQAQAQFDARKLTTPRGDNARETYLRVLALDPSDRAAQQGLERIRTTYVDWAREAEAARRWDEARIYYRRAQSLAPADAALAAAIERVVAQERGARARATADTVAADAALRRAARTGQAQAVAAALEQGASVDARDTRGKTPLMWAVQAGDLALVRQLDASGADPTLSTDSGDTALMYAAQDGHAAIARFLVENGAAVDAANGLGWTALMYAAVGGHGAVVRELLARGADVNALTAERKSPLMAAARNGHAAVVRSLLEAGARINESDRSRWTSLMYAAWQGQMEVVEILLDANANFDVRNVEGQTALTLGIVRRNRDIIDRLVQAGAQR